MATLFDATHSTQLTQLAERRDLGASAPASSLGFGNRSETFAITPPIGDSDCEEGLRPRGSTGGRPAGATTASVSGSPDGALDAGRAHPESRDHFRSRRARPHLGALRAQRSSAQARWTCWKAKPI